MSTWKTLASLAAVAAGAAAAAVLSKKKAPAEAAKSKAAEKPAEKTPIPANTKTGEYSFVGGYSAALNSVVTLEYDADKFSFDIVEDNTLNDTNVSHVAIMNSEKLDIQIEYAEFYPGEGMDELKKNDRERYNDYEELSFGSNSYLKYTDGDCICLVKSVSGNAECYVVISLFKAKDNDDKLPQLLTYPEIVSLLASVSTTTL